MLLSFIAHCKFPQLIAQMYWKIFLEYWAWDVIRQISEKKINK